MIQSPGGGTIFDDGESAVFEIISICPFVIREISREKGEMWLPLKGSLHPGEGVHIEIFKDSLATGDVMLCLCTSKQNKRPKHNARGCSWI
jgi:hypothetical protein